MNDAVQGFGARALGALDARYEAQKIAFGPIVFQCVNVAWKWGLLQALSQAGDEGLDNAALARQCDITPYASDILMQSCLSAGVVALAQERFRLSKVGYCILADKLTQINFNFMADVCYTAMAHLEESLRQERPAGLATLGPWPTLYDGLAQMDEPARGSWLRFDNYYSDTAFPMVVATVLAGRPARLMDIGANTGKWAAQCLAHDPELRMVLVDLPGQLRLAMEHVEHCGYTARVTPLAVNVLDPALSLPGSMDVVWMSQFVSCFSETELSLVLSRARDSLADGGEVFIMDTFWDSQSLEIASFCLLNTSAYFTAIANGNSKMYAAPEVVRIAASVGLELQQRWDDIGYCHSLLRLARQ